MLHTSPCFQSVQLKCCDDILRSSSSAIVSVDFENNDRAWMQATLPVIAGGLGILSGVELAHSAFSTSVAGSFK